VRWITLGSSNCLASAVDVVCSRCALVLQLCAEDLVSGNALSSDRKLV